MKALTNSIAKLVLAFAVAGAAAGTAYGGARSDVLHRYLATQQSVPLRPDVRDRSSATESTAVYVNAPGRNVNPQWFRDVAARESQTSQTSIPDALSSWQAQASQSPTFSKLDANDRRHFPAGSDVSSRYLVNQRARVITDASYRTAGSQPTRLVTDASDRVDRIAAPAVSLQPGPTGGGFDWGDAGIGAGGATLALMLLATAMLSVRHVRRRAIGF